MLEKLKRWYSIRIKTPKRPVPWLLILLSILPLSGYAQETRQGEWIYCVEGFDQAELRRSNITSDLTAAFGAFKIWGTDIPEQAFPAIDSALALWSRKITSPIPIKIQMNWTTVDGNFLAKTRPVTYMKNFSKSAPTNIWYPIALAEKIANTELNQSSEFEIEIALNSAINWYYGTDGQPGTEEFDLLTILLHELAHGLGFVSSANLTADGVSFSSDGDVDIYDQQLVTSDFSRLAAFNDDPSLLKEKVTSDDVYFLGENNDLLKCYAINLFLPSVSLSHLDDEPDQKKLMVPYFATGEAFPVIDTSTLEVLQSMGWGETKPTNVTTYPNPAAERVTFRLPVYLDALSIDVYNAQGKKIMDITSKSSNNALISIDISTLDPGLYYFILTNSKFHFHKTVKVLVKR